MAVYNLENLTKKAEEEKEKFVKYLTEFQEELDKRNMVYKIVPYSEEKKIYKILNIEFLFGLYMYDFNYNYQYTKIKVFKVLRNLNNEIKEIEQIYYELFVDIKAEKEKITKEIIGAIEEIIVDEREIKIF